MSTNQIRMANPSVTLPTYGRVLGMPACAQVDTRVSIAIQGKTAGLAHVTSLVEGIDSRTKGAFPGNPAWRPPTS